MAEKSNEMNLYDDLIELKETDSERLQLLKLLLQMDRINRAAWIIRMESLKAGDSDEVAMQKGAAFLRSQPGYEEEAQRWIDSFNKDHAA